MFEKSKVIWSEGMFLLPQHFQQHNRYLENLINRRCMGLHPYNWGFYSLKIDSDLLKMGKLALKECKGIFPDGTPFNLPEDDDLPLPLDVSEDTRNEIVFLSLPLRRPEAVEIDSTQNPEGLARFRMGELEVRDNTNGTQTKAHLQIGKLKTRLLRQREERSGYTGLGVARIIEVRADKNIVIDDQFIPANLNCFAMPCLRGFLRDIHGKLHTRGEAIAGHVITPGRGGVGEFTEFLLLQLVNRYQPLFEHLSNMVGLHPEDFYRLGIQLAGELATFYQTDKRPVSLSPYNHEDLQATFGPLMDELGQLLTKTGERPAIKLKLTQAKKDEKIYGAKTPDQDLLKNAVFVLAAKADVQTETLRRDFPQQIKIAPVEEIYQYVHTLKSGISVEPFAQVPPQIPFHAGFVYFELQKHGQTWKKMAESGGFAIHNGGNFPGLKLEFWAIR
jgi:type VI secretion system protein ImpJ